VADPSTYRPAPGTIPDAPGVYRFRDPTGRVIYVGKAKSLRSRLNSYFGDVWHLHQRTQQMVTTAASVDWVTVGSEVEALQLEYSWIKEYDPRFNVRYRDDKSYPYLAVTLDEEFPRLQVMRGAKRKGVRYFGPYSHAWAIRETLDLLLRVFPARTCSSGVFKRANQVGRPCLLGYIGKCSAPCVGRVTPEEHRELADVVGVVVADDPHLGGLEAERGERAREERTVLVGAVAANELRARDEHPRAGRSGAAGRRAQPSCQPCGVTVITRGRNPPTVTRCPPTLITRFSGALTLSQKRLPRNGSRSPFSTIPSNTTAPEGPSRRIATYDEPRMPATLR